MDVFDILLMSLSTSLIVEGRKRMTSKFDIQKDTSVNSSIQSFLLYRKLSLASCAAECNKDPNECCSVTYMTDDMSCRLYSCCFPPTVTTTGAKHLRKLLKQGSADFPADCSEIPSGSVNGVYTIAPTDTLQIDVYCDFTVEPGTAWTVVQRRIDGAVDFYVNWEAYREGFGDIRTEFWIGNNILNIMSNLKRYILRVDMEDSNGVTAYAEYDTFTVADEGSQYKLSIGGYSGTAGDSMSIASGMKFSTLDLDNDLSTSIHCAANLRKGGWWHRTCGRANPNGIYQNPGTNGKDTMFWLDFRDFTALNTISMKMKPL